MFTQLKCACQMSEKFPPGFSLWKIWPGTISSRELDKIIYLLDSLILHKNSQIPSFPLSSASTQVSEPSATDITGRSSSVVELTASSGCLFTIPSSTVLVVSASIDSISYRNIQDCLTWITIHDPPGRLPRKQDKKFIGNFEKWGTKILFRGLGLNFFHH